MSKKRELVKNTLIIALGKMSTQLLSFLLLPLYTAYLPTNEYGTVDLIITYVVLFAPIITIQLEMAAFRFLIDARSSESEKTKIISSTLTAIGLFLSIAGFLYIIATKFIDIQFAYLILASISTTIFSNLFLQFARGLGKNKHFAIGSIVAGVTVILSNIILIVMLHMGAQGMLTSMILANIACSIYLFIALQLHKYVDFGNIDKTYSQIMLRYSAPLVPNGISWWIINAADRTIISLFLGLSANGIFAIAYKFPMIFSTLFSFFSMSWTESASIHINDKNRNQFFSETHSASIRLFGSLGLMLIAYIPLTFSLLVNADYHEAYLYTPILIVGAFFNSIVGLYSAVYIAKKMTKQVANTSIVAAGINIILTLGLIQFIGLYAAAIATAVAYLAMAIYRHYDVKKYVAITYEKNVFVKLILAYALTITLYYYNNLIGNIANAVFITVIVILFNRSISKVIKDRVFTIGSRREQPLLAPEQEVQEKLL